MGLDPVRPNRPDESDTGRYMGVGLAFAASILLFFFLGQWLDRRLGTDPWLMIAGVVVGGSAGFWSMYRRLVVEPRDKDRGGKP
jgi:F0F1-type ATP synthase assembly protein I